MDQRQLRFFLFGIAILVGIAAGMFLGWEIIPAREVKAEPQTLQIDFKTDYVLMVSELFNQENDLEKALTRLTYLGESSPARMMESVVEYADEIAYDSSDLQLMLMLFSSVLNR